MPIFNSALPLRTEMDYSRNPNGCFKKQNVEDVPVIEEPAKNNALEITNEQQEQNVDLTNEQDVPAMEEPAKKKKKSSTTKEIRKNPPRITEKQRNLSFHSNVLMRYHEGIKNDTEDKGRSVITTKKNEKKYFRHNLSR